MPPAKKRKVARKAEKSAEDQPVPETVEQTPAAADSEAPAREEDSKEEKKAEVEPPVEKSENVAAPATTTPEEEAAAKAKASNERVARFRALQARAKTSSDQNLKAAAAESQRLAADPAQLTALHRQHAIASHKLLKADVEEAGGDFERKRAWDWTAEESERWDKRMRKKEVHRDDNAFQDHRQEALKVYKRQVRHNMAAPDLERYARDKMAAIERAAAAGTLDIVEMEDGELVAVDRDGSFFSTADSLAFAENRPSKEAIDRLVGDQRKAEEIALKKRRERMAKNGEDPDVTYINEKNKQFNQKLARFYNKYTAEIRESFERGTMV